jgi:hypothetical protein
MTTFKDRLDAPSRYSDAHAPQRHFLSLSLTLLTTRRRRRFPPVDVTDEVIQLEIPSAARAVDGSLTDKRLLSLHRRVYAE